MDPWPILPRTLYLPICSSSTRGRGDASTAGLARGPPEPDLRPRGGPRKELGQGLLHVRKGVTEALGGIALVHLVLDVRRVGELRLLQGLAEGRDRRGSRAEAHVGVLLVRTPVLHVDRDDPRLVGLEEGQRVEARGGEMAD